ncbi:MAG: thiamine phosphate synthase [Candidatus Omnitrophica bacterium]|nr:thiamine phosphate synthase [Candidatus Omnitrophota bacterium]
MLSKKTILKRAKFYVVLDNSVADFKELLRVLKKTVDAGAGIIQLRSKDGSAREILAFCQKANAYVKGKALFIVNDRLDLALAGDCDGVHLGQHDLPLDQARKICGAGKMIGVSCQTLNQSLQAQKQGADYIGFGSVFTTKTKPERSPMNLKLLSEIGRKIKIPVFFIGGITLVNLDRVVEYGGRRVAVTRAICKAKDVKGTTKKFLQRLEPGN